MKLNVVAISIVAVVLSCLRSVASENNTCDVDLARFLVGRDQRVIVSMVSVTSSTRVALTPEAFEEYMVEPGPDFRIEIHNARFANELGTTLAAVPFRDVGISGYIDARYKFEFLSDGGVKEVVYADAIGSVSWQGRRLVPLQPNWLELLWSPVFRSLLRSKPVGLK